MQGDTDISVRWTMRTANGCPVDEDVFVLVWLRNGDQFTVPEKAGTYSWARANWLERILWPRLAALEIIAYRVIGKETPHAE
jgi:hypothetical protein